MGRAEFCSYWEDVEIDVPLHMQFCEDCCLGFAEFLNHCWILYKSCFRSVNLFHGKSGQGTHIMTIGVWSGPKRVSIGVWSGPKRVRFTYLIIFRAVHSQVAWWNGRVVF